MCILGQGLVFIKNCYKLGKYISTNKSGVKMDLMTRYYHTNPIRGSPLVPHYEIPLHLANPLVVSRTIRGHYPEHDEKHRHLNADGVKTPVPTVGLCDDAHHGPCHECAERVAQQGA